MPRRIRFEGQTIIVPDDATDDEIAEILGGGAPSEPASAVERLLSMAKDVGIGAAKGLGGTVTGLGEMVHMIPGVTGAVDRLYGQPGLSERAFDVADQELTATNTPQMVGKGLEMAAEIALPSMMAARKVPTTAKAAAKFEGVMKAAHARPVDVSQAGDVALRIQDLADRGGSMPMVVRKFLRRITDPDLGDLTYKEGRDFASNISRLSANEYQRLTPVIKREVDALRVALNTALERTASSVGKGDDYARAMKEYRRAMQLRDLKDEVVKWGTRGALGYGAYQGAKGVGIVD